MKFYASFPITPEACLSNRAINYGDGLFETMLVVNGRIPLWGFHFQRLDEGLRRLNMDAVAKSLIYSKVMSLIDDKHTYIAKLVIFRDDEKRGFGSQSCQSQFFIRVDSYHKPTICDKLTVSVVTLAKQKQLAGLKHLNRLEQVMAAQELASTQYSDAIMLDNKQRVIETISKNIVLIKNNKLYTPKLNNCGVYGVALRWLQAQGFELKWKKIEFKSLQKYDGMMVCNSIQGFTTINTIAQKITFKHQLDMANKIQMQWDRFINS